MPIGGISSCHRTTETLLAVGQRELVHDDSSSDGLSTIAYGFCALDDLDTTVALGVDLRSMIVAPLLT